MTEPKHPRNSLSIVAEQTCSLVIPSHPFPWRQRAELLHQKIDHRSHLRRRVAIVRIGCKNAAHGMCRVVEFDWNKPSRAKFGIDEKGRPISQALTIHCGGDERFTIACAQIS